MAFIGSKTLAATRLSLFLLASAASVSTFFLSRALRAASQQSALFLFHRLTCRAMGLEVEVRGEMSRARPTLFVSNHVSYFDIPVLGSLIAGSFVAKAQVADWPVFGPLAKLQRTIFIEREGRQAADQRNVLRDRLSSGESVILFPEGTTADGNRVLPFKSSLFAIAEAPIGDQPVLVQAVSIAYTRLDDIPMGRAFRPFYAWYGDMTLFDHLWQALGLGRATVVVEFHPPTTIEQSGSRKILSRHCQSLCAEGVSSALAG